MNQIVLNGFKSYEELNLNKLSPHLNVIIGKNGEGKSNIFRAIHFALSDKVSLNANTFNSYAHKNINNQLQDISVKICFSGKNINQEEEDSCTVERIWKKEDLRQEYRIAQKLSTKQETQNFVETLGVCYSNPYNIIQQGKITEITLMNEEQLYMLLQDCAGVKKYQKRLEDASNELRKTEEEKKEINEIISNLKEKLKVIESKKDQFEYYNIEELSRKIKSKKDYQKNLEFYKNQLEILKGKQASSLQSLSLIKQTIKNQNIVLEGLSNMQKVNWQQINYLKNEQLVGSQLIKTEANLSQTEKNLKQQIEHLQKDQMKIQKQLMNVGNKIIKRKEEIKPYKEKYQMFLNEKEMSKNVEKTSKQKTRDSYQKDIEKMKQDQKKMQKQISKLNKLKIDFKWSNEGKEKQTIELIKEQQNSIMKSLKSNKVKQLECNRLKNQFQSELQINKAQAESNYSKMKKILPYLDMNLLNHLRKEKVEGVYGFMIQFIDIQPDITFAYEIAGLSKLCTLLVENDKVCAKVIEVNKKLKGRQINILPLSFVSRQAIQKRNYPKMQDCYSLLNQDWVKVRLENPYGTQFNKCLQKILGSTFNRYALVKDYQMGLQVSKQYHLNCITTDREVIYSEGYLCKLGKEDQRDDRMDSYYKYKEKYDNSVRNQISLKQIDNDLLKHQNEEIQIINKQREVQFDFRKAQQKLLELTSQQQIFNKMNEQQEKMVTQKERISLQIDQRKNLVQNLKKKNQFKINQVQFQELKKNFIQKTNMINKEIETEGQVEEKAFFINKKLQQSIEELKSIEQKLNFRNELTISSSEEEIKKLTRKNEELAIEQSNISKQIEKMEEELNKANSENASYRGDLGMLEEELIETDKKLKEMLQIEGDLQELEQRSNSLSFSMNRSFIEDKKKTHHYSIKEKLIFEKVGSFYERFLEYDKYYKQLLSTEEKIQKVIATYDEEKNDFMRLIFNNFEKQFVRIFERISVDGRSQVLLKKVSDRSRGFLKFRNRLSVKVSFEEDLEPQSWSDFSLGQKTVIAISILMALQKCEPSPFYIFDEIDSALDSNFLRKVIHLVRQESQHSQYLITSFKKEWMDYSQELCNYYLVQSQERRSRLRRIKRENADQVISSIIG